MMEQQRQRSGGGRKGKRGKQKAKSKSEPKNKPDPVFIVARRPDSPLLMKVSNRNIAASARPKKPRGVNGSSREAEAGGEFVEENAQHAPTAVEPTVPAEKERRVARIAAAPITGLLDDATARRERLLERLILSEGRSAITRVANELLETADALPETQEVQLQLLEHVDERRAKDAMVVLERLWSSQAPIKRPILDQRLRRLESEADDAEIRTKAAQLRRTLRVA
jgi:hypothetical protein